MAEAYIVAAARTAGGRKGGRLAGWHPADLAASVLNALVDRTGVDPALVDDVIMGCVGQGGEQAVNVRATPCWPRNCRKACPAPRSTANVVHRSRRCISRHRQSCPAQWTS